MELSEIIQKYLNQNNHNWSWLSEETGISREIIYGIKNKKRYNITLRNLLKIVRVLDIDMNDFKDVDFK